MDATAPRSDRRTLHWDWETWGGVVVVLGVLLAGSAGPAWGQEWRQRAAVQAEVTNDGPIRTVLDSLTDHLEAADSVAVRRSPEAPRIPLDTLRKQLLGEGLGILSTNRVVIRYTFVLRRDQLVERIRSLQFLCRLPNTARTRRPTLFVRGGDPRLDDVLRPRESAGRLLPDALASPLSQPEALPMEVRFPKLVRRGRVSDWEAHRRPLVLVGRLQSLVYERGTSYVTIPH